MQSYVAGFMIEDGRRVALVRKLQPEWQRGKLNGIGGKVELGETPAEAMRREFLEEAGCETATSSWRLFATLTDEDAFEVHFYVMHVAFMPSLRTMEKERILIVPVAFVTVDNAIPNVTWLLRMAMTLGRGEKAAGFVVKEVTA